MNVDGIETPACTLLDAQREEWQLLGDRDRLALILNKCCRAEESIENGPSRLCRSPLTFVGMIPAASIESGLYRACHAIRIMTADGELYIFPRATACFFRASAIVSAPVLLWSVVVLFRPSECGKLNLVAV